MPTAKKALSDIKEEPVMCDNHPDVTAGHVTDGKLHQVIALCTACLRRVPHMKQR